MKDALKGSDVDAIKTASEKLNEAWQSVSAELYKAAAEKAKEKPQEGGASEEPTSGKSKGGKDDGPIIDAEVVDENKLSEAIIFPQRVRRALIHQSNRNNKG